MDSCSTENVYEEFASSTIGKLKDYLSARGFSCQGNKQQLVSRCYVAWESKAPLKYSEKQQLEILTKEYGSRLQECEIEDPQSYNKDVWSVEIKNWPKIDLGKIFSFIISKKEQEMEFIGAYKSQKAFSYYMSGFVDTIFSTSINGKQIVKSKVTPSQSVRNDPQDVWIVMENGNILASWCRCIAGHAQTCNHVIAVLYKMEYATTMGYNDPSCTTVPCGWNASTKKDVQPCRLTAMNPRKDDRRKLSGAALDQSNANANLNTEFKQKYDPRREDQRTVCGTDLQFLYSSLNKALPKAVLFTGFPSTNPKPTIPKSLLQIGEDLSHSENCTIEQFMEEINLTPEQTVLVEEQSRGQLNNTWVEQRKGRITASLFHEVGKKMDGLLKKQVKKTTPLVSKILGTSNSLEHIPAIRYGRQKEPIARQLFAAYEAEKHKKFKVCLSGLWVKSDRPYIAGSPDGIVTCQCCPDKVLEIKCPMTFESKSPLEHVASIDYLKIDKDKNLILNPKHEYYSQMQGQMVVTGCKEGYFFMYSPVRSITIKVKFDPQFWVQVREKLTIFFKEYIVPYLIHTKHLYICPKCNKVCYEIEEIADPGDNSILCDCCRLWYHWKCADIKVEPKDNTWVCSNCLLIALDL